MITRVSNKVFSAIKSWASRIDTKTMKEDIRKSGMVLVGAGYVGIIVGGDKISSLEGIVLVLTGIIAWAIGLIREEDNGD